MMERLTLRAAIARSWRLTDRFFWRTFGIQLLVSVIVSTATNIVTQPIAFIGALVVGLGNPLNDIEAYTAAGVAVVYLATLVVALIASSIGLIVQSAAAALIYIDLRMRKEGLDVELVRFVEARQARRHERARPLPAARRRLRARGAGCTLVVTVLPFDVPVVLDQPEGQDWLIEEPRSRSTRPRGRPSGTRSSTRSSTGCSRSRSAECRGRPPSASAS